MMTPIGRSQPRKLLWVDETSALLAYCDGRGTLKRQAYGFRDPEYFKLKILAIHHSRLELVG